MIASALNVYDSIPYRKNTRNQRSANRAPTSCRSRVRWGTNAHNHTVPDLTEPIAWIREMAQLGVAMVNVSMGSPYATPHVTRPFEYAPPDGYETPEHPLIGVARHFHATAAIQHAVPQIPIVGSGYSYLREFVPHAGAANLRDRRCRRSSASAGRTLAAARFRQAIARARPARP